MPVRRALFGCLLTVLPGMGLADDSAFVWTDPAPVSRGFSFHLGGSLSVRPQTPAPATQGRAAVFAPTPLPDTTPRETLGQVRVGVGWQGANAAAFYGVTYLTPQFSNQPEGQLIGSFSLSLRF